MKSWISIRETSADHLVELQDRYNLMQLVFTNFKLAIYQDFDKSTIFITYSRGHQTCSWRAGILQIIAPTLIKHTWTS